MLPKNFRNLLLISFLLFIIIPFAYSIPKELGPFCKVDWNLTGKAEEETIVFDFTCNVTLGGWMGLGLSKNGAMMAADIVTIRLLPNGTNFLDDRHGIGNKKPVLDVHQDVKLISLTRNGNQTYVKFSRLLNTCDKEDLEITDETLKLIWAVGPLLLNEKLDYHHPENRGAITVNFFEKMVAISPDLKRNPPLRFEQNIVLNGNDTLYSCKIEKSPLKEKHHVIGFELHFGSSQSKQYSHHASFLSCSPPQGITSEKFFSQYVNQVFDCYYSEKYFPTEYCKSFEYQWTYGGTTTTLPQDLGFPIGEQTDQYYMTVFHINNPDKRKGIDFRVGFDLFYTKELRKVDVGFLQLGLNSSQAYSLTIPPNSTNYVSASHCPGECTKLFPSTGVQVFAYLLHFHLSGRKMRIRHFRDGVELPWLAKDDNYDTNYQLNRMMRKPITIMQNDHLTVECEFDTKWLNGSTVIGGRGIEDEMCQAFVMYFPRIKELNRCGSSVDQDTMLKFMGIEKVEKEKGGNNPKVLAPASMNGKRYTQVVSGLVNWNSGTTRANFQNLTRFGSQLAICRGQTGNNQMNIVTKYPTIKKEYAPLNKCTTKQQGSGGGKGSSAKNYPGLQPNLQVLFCIAIVSLNFY